MQPREYALPPDLQYVLDGGVESDYFTGGAHFALSVFGDTKMIEEISERPRPGCRGWQHTASMLLDLEAYGQDLIGQMETELQTAARSASTVSFIKCLSGYSDFIAGSAFEDAIWGGSMIDRHADRIDWRGRIEKRLERRLHTDGFVKRTVRRYMAEDGARHLVAMWHLLGRELPPVDPRGFELLNKVLDSQRERRAARDREMIRRIQGIKNDLALCKRRRRRARRVTIRAAAIASAVLGATTVSAFARGEPVRFPAADIVVQAQLGRSVHAEGHGALKISLYDDCDRYLSNLCLYQDLPALDQLASLALHVQSGGIGEIIETGNLYNYSSVAFSHPLLAPKKPSPNLDRGLAAMGEMERRRALAAQYGNDMGDCFRRRFFLEVLGRQAGEAWSVYSEMRSGRE